MRPADPEGALGGLHPGRHFITRCERPPAAEPCATGPTLMRFAVFGCRFDLKQETGLRTKRSAARDGASLWRLE